METQTNATTTTPTDAAPVDRAPTLEQIKLARRAATPAAATGTPAAGATTTTAATTAAPAGDATTTTAPDAANVIDIDEKALDTFVKLSRENRELKTAQKAQEAKIALATRMEEALALAKQGKQWDAIKLAGFDFDQASMEVLNIQGEKVDPKIAALEAEIEKLKAGTTKTQEAVDAEAVARQAAERTAGMKQITAYVTKEAAKYPYLAAKPDRVDEAMKGADDAYPKLKEQLGRELTDAEKNRLVMSALEEGEAVHAARAKEYGAVPAAKPPAASPTFTSSMRSSLGASTSRVAETPGRVTLEQLKAERRAKTAGN